MTQQTNGMPDLKYSEETFRDMYEALKKLGNTTQWQRIPEYLAKDIVEALAKAEGRRENGQT